MSGETLDVVTINVWGLPWPFARHRAERLQRVAEHVHATGYHLVGIQELWRSVRRALAVERLHLPKSRGDSGLALAGAMAAEVEVEPFAFAGSVDRLKQKGFLRAVTRTPLGEELAVVVTHLQAGARHAEVRARQIGQLLDRLKAEARPTVLMGDFNLHAGPAADRRSEAHLEAEGFVDAAMAALRPEVTYGDGNPYVRASEAERLDRIYVRGTASTRLEVAEVSTVRGDRPFSDHHPLRARLRVRRG